MTDSSRTNQELLEENDLLKQKIHELEKSGSEFRQMNGVLQENDNWLQTIIEGTHALLVTVDINGYFTYANDATARAVGCKSSEELIGKPYLHFVHLEDRQKVLGSFINQVNTLQQSCMQEFRITDTKGKVKWVSFLSSLMMRDGQVIGQTGVAQDITERKQAEQINRILFLISDAVNSTEDLLDLYRTIRLILGSIIDVTNFFIAIIDRSKRTLYFPYHVDTVDEDFSPLDDFDTESSLTGLIVAEKKPMLLRNEELQERDAQNGIWGPSPLSWMGSPLLIREEVIGVVALQSYTNPDAYDEADLQLLTAVSQQIAIAIDRKRFLDKLQESEERLNFLVKNSSDSLVIINADGNQRYISPAAERITGFPIAELQGRSIETLIHPDDIKVVMAAWNEAVKHPEKTVTVQYRHIHKSQGWVFSEAIAQSFLNEPATRGIIASVRDITEHKRVERFLRDVIKMNPMSIQILDKDGLTLEANDSYNLLFGAVPPPDYSLFSDPQLMQMGIGELFDQLRNGATVRFPDTYFNAHDSVPEFPDTPAWVRALGFPLNDDNGKPERFVLMHENITERKQAEQMLRENEEHLSSIFRSAPIGIGSVVNRELKRVNSRLCEMTGYSEGELVGQSSRILYPSSEDFEFVGREKYAQIRDHGTGTVETHWQHKDGTIIEILLSSTPVDMRDHSKGVTFTALDITERKQAEADLLAERQYLRDIIDFLPDATFIIDNDQRVVVWNRAAEAMTGVQRDDLLGKGDYAYAVPFYGERRPILIDLLNISEKERESSYSYVNRVADKVYAEAFIQTLNDGDGAYLWGVAAPLYDRNGVRTGAVEVIKDITDLKKSEKANIQLQAQLMQAQKIEAIGQLAGGVAHDFNNMLGVIIGYAELILTQVNPSQQFHAELEEIQKAAHRSADLTRQLLTFARKQTVAPKVLDLNQTVEGMLNMLRRLIGENIHLIWMPGTCLWPIKMDPSQIDQILANLCVNARDAIAGVGKITVATENTPLNEKYCDIHAGSTPGEYVRITVSDTGNGMDKDTLAHIFEPFFTTKGVGEGTGLGLATVYGAVKQNNGFINAYSEPGLGTTFTIYIPRYTDKVLPSIRTVTGESILSGTETILLVEDEPMILEMTKYMLVRQGYHVLTAASPREAIRLAKEKVGSIDLLMTDVIMPEMNGRDLAKQLFTISPNIKCLFMSGYTASVIEPHGVLSEGLHFIQKPFNMKDLAASIREALES